MSPSLDLSSHSHGNPERRERPQFAFVAERLWLDFVNTDTGVRGPDALHDFNRFVLWRDRLAWTVEELERYFADPDVHVWSAHVRGHTAGYFELKHHPDRTVEV